MLQFDIKQKRPFLKRTKFSHIKDIDLYVGALVTVYTRQFKIVAYADAFTKINLDKLFDKTFMIIKPKAMYDNMGHVIHQIQMSGFRIANVLM